MANETVIGGAPPPAPLRLNGQQIATLLLLEMQLAQLQIGANQLGSFLKDTEAADLLVSAISHIGRGKEKLMKKWSGAVVIAQPGDVVRLVP